LKTIGEIAIEAGLVNKAGAAKAGKLSEEKKEPLVVMLVRELGVDELALVGALRKQTRVPLLDPASVQIDAEALRMLSRDICARLRVMPLSVATDGSTKVMRIAMADPTDTAAVAELEQLTHSEIDVSALPLSAIEELVAKGYKQINTAVVNRPLPSKPAAFAESETSVTAQIPMSVLQAPDDLEQRVTALMSVLVAKGIVTEAEITEALAKLKTPS
jgi:type II secretion system (T2SS) protein E